MMFMDGLKVLVTGSRNITPDGEMKIESFIKYLSSGTIVIHGGAQGVDSCIEKCCRAYGITTKVVRPLYNDKREYYLYRNAEMVGMCDIVYAFWDGKSRGTKFTIDYARLRGKVTHIVEIEEGGKE